MQNNNKENTSATKEVETSKWQLCGDGICNIHAPFAERIKKITLKGTSGYCICTDAYEDKLVITPESISYEYIPRIKDLETNVYRKWSYKTTSSAFTEIFQKVAEKTPYYLYNDDKLFATDIGPTEIIVTFDDRHKENTIYCCPSEFFKEYFNVIKKLVPQTEDTPAVIMTDDDYDD